MVMMAFVVAALAVCVGILLAAQETPRTERLSLVLLLAGAVTATAGLVTAVGSGWPH
jgi:hypothetical protein